ncbi:MAG: molybdate ABC transporter substrate-binding protein [Gordonia sp. (in: high G+C Gram-positive bacteria)]|uniref:molybdate ABC transporter substrate-binding protein n=1 Tax=Gordonia sp. (in: high G+C Gram-positive bacteria) TaxID=84139 RepID=UPI0039E69C96
MQLRRVFGSVVAVGAAVAMAASVTACGTSDDAGSDAHTVRVMAAASLVDVMDPLTEAYRGDHSGAQVQVDAAASSALVQRLKSGAQADVLITADTKTMADAVAAGVAKDPVTVATNKLVIVVPKGNPGKVTGLDYFTRAGNRSVICASEVPCGRAAEKAITAAGGQPKPLSRAVDVRAALGSVTSGEADAALVYATNATSAGDKVATVEIPNAPVVEYPAAALTDGGKDFVNLLTSDQGKKILTDAGFGLK